MIRADHILDLALRYAAAENIALSTVSSRVFADGKKLDAIQRLDADLTLKRAASALEWFSNHWPAEAEWPPEVARPTPSDLEKSV